MLSPSSGTKRCSSCGEAKPHEEFNRQRNKPDGLQSYCRPCGRRASRERYTSNLDREREKSRLRARLRDPEVVRTRNREWSRRNPEKIRVQNLRRYSLTVEDFDRLVESQAGRCAACGAGEPGGQGRWHIDHDHNCCSGSKRSCGRCIRGLLCSRCNVALGLVQDNRETLMSLIDYLQTHAVG